MIGYPSGQDGAISCPLGISRLVPQDQRSFFGVLSHIINPLLTKLVRSRWLDIGLVLFLCVYGPRPRLVHKHAKKELGQYPAILTSCLVNNPYLMNACLGCLEVGQCTHLSVVIAILFVTWCNDNHFKITYT